MLDSLIASPVRAVKATAYSASVASVLASTRARNTAPPSASNTEGAPRPCGLAIRRPSSRAWRCQLETALADTRKRRAISAPLASPASHASNTRSRKSAE